MKLWLVTIPTSREALEQSVCLVYSSRTIHKSFNWKGYESCPGYSEWHFKILPVVKKLDKIKQKNSIPDCGNMYNIEVLLMNNENDFVLRLHDYQTIMSL